MVISQFNYRLDAMDKLYLIIEWIEEEQTYNVVERGELLDPAQWELESELIGMVVNIKWEESAPGKVLAISKLYIFV